MNPGELQMALAKLYRRNLHTIKLGLDPVRALLEELGNPHEKFLCVHIAGTNGKGSVSALIESMLRAAGIRTGLYISPHLVRFNERIRVNGAEISDEKLAPLLDDIEAAVLNMRGNTGERDATFFEFTTALAFEHFRRERVQIAVIETGMGGRLDATNVITPIVSVITSISFDHQQFLGDTIEKIAAEKAGIIKEHRPVVVGELPGEAIAVIEKTAKHHYSPLNRAAASVSVRRQSQSWMGQKVQIETSEESLGTAMLPLLGDHQLGNLAVAVAAIEELRRETKLPIRDEAIRAGIAATRWPGRCQVLSADPPVILDGAHNVEAAEVLARTVRQLGKKVPWAGVAGFLSDKDVAGIVRPFASFIKELWIVELHNERAMPPANAMDRLHGLSIHPHTGSIGDALGAAKAWAGKNAGGVVIFGSLYLAGEILGKISSEDFQQ